MRGMIALCSVMLSMVSVTALAQRVHGPGEDRRRPPEYREEDQRDVRRRPRDHEREGERERRRPRDRDEDRGGWDREELTFPYDGPQRFANSTGREIYSWSFSGIDENGCNRCITYSPRVACDAHMIGQRMKARQPGTRDNDYVYTCQAGPGNQLPWDGPQDFRDTRGRGSFQWRFEGTDENGCHRCQVYSPRLECNSRTVGLRMKSPQPGTRDNDYVYQCVQEN